MTKKRRKQLIDAIEYYKSRELVSGLQIGEPCWLCIEGNAAKGYVRAITFTNAKVRYAVRLKRDWTTVHNVDSVYVSKRKTKKPEWMVTKADNYS